MGLYSYSNNIFQSALEVLAEAAPLIGVAVGTRPAPSPKTREDELLTNQPNTIEVAAPNARRPMLYNQPIFVSSSDATDQWSVCERTSPSTPTTTTVNVLGGVYIQWRKKARKHEIAVRRPKFISPHTNKTLVRKKYSSAQKTFSSRKCFHEKIDIAVKLQKLYHPWILVFWRK